MRSIIDLLFLRSVSFLDPELREISDPDSERSLFYSNYTNVA